MKAVSADGIPAPKNSFVIRPGVRLFLMSIPCLLLVFVFSYVPLSGWAYAFFDYRAGMKLSECEFVGLKYFVSIANNPIVQMEIVRVMRNTFAMSFLGLLTSPLPMIFAIFLSEIKAKRYRGLLQTATTVPNFISWVLVYSVAWSVFAVDDGFLNRLLLAIGIIGEPINFLASTNNVWVTMVGYQIWKGLGWSAVLYLAAITSIDQELYEAATVDGAGRFGLIWHITVPGLMPTYFVLLLLSVANFINNGMEQYFIFQNPMNKNFVEVLDLYVYNKGLVGSNVPFATAVGMLKSVVSIVLLFLANQASKRVRGETII